MVKLKVQTECIPCQFENAVHQSELATDDEDLQFEAVLSYLEFLGSNFSKDKPPAHFGYEKNRIIRETTSNLDPYSELKRSSNELATMLEPLAEEFVDEGKNREERLDRTLKVSAVANSMEFGVSDYDFDSESFKSEFKRLFSKGLEIDDREKVATKLLESEDVLFLADNAGEIVLDRVLLGEIDDSETDLYIGVKTKPVQEDVTLEEARDLNLGEFGELVPTGEKIGLFLDEIPDRVGGLLENSEFIVSKGMGNFETISEFEDELEGRLSYVLRGKCIPVSRRLGVEQGSLVVKYL